MSKDGDGPLANESKVNRLRKLESERSKRDVDDLREVMNTAAGRRFVHKVIKDAGINSVIVRRTPDGMTDTHLTFFAEGRRNYGLEIMARLTKELPEAQIQMQTEVVRMDSAEIEQLEALRSEIAAEDRNDG